MKKVVLRILTIVFLIGSQSTVQSAEQIKQKYKDAFSREANLFKNPEFYNKFKTIKDTQIAKVNGLEAKNLIASINIDKIIEEIKKTYAQAFAKARNQLNSPYYKKELVVDPMLIPLIKDQNNPYYDSIMKTIEDFKNALHKHAHKWMPVSYAIEIQKIKDQEKTATFDLMGEYDPELKKAHEELGAIDNQ